MLGHEMQYTGPSSSRWALPAHLCCQPQPSHCALPVVPTRALSVCGQVQRVAGAHQPDNHLCLLQRVVMTLHPPSTILRTRASAFNQHRPSAGIRLCCRAHAAGHPLPGRSATGHPSTFRPVCTIVRISFQPAGIRRRIAAPGIHSWASVAGHPPLGHHPDRKSVV